ncbi:hypothetical protein [Mesorhizobium sp. B2-3-5]|uniref:hypothetical protein n=1 Tax=Mesorhizobium sp. B2-3-5 TaxID=2589958 RepID=UPI001126D220|nr:hypothetical protein [Mesorhizobium sp. B2-3-5]TPM36640.1 hypothetical protein FJ958_02105 [Mesorhizobium sp. B2-3-5]
MGQIVLNLGTSGNDGTGTPLREAGDAINDMTGELYSQFGLMPPNPQTGTSYTFALDDLGTCTTLDNASPIAATIPAHADVAFPVGAIIAAAGIGAGAVTVTGDTGVTVNGSSGGSVVLDGSMRPAAFWQYDTDAWMAFGRFA